MTYAVKECFLTVQGEGGQAGRAAVFLRFSGCNLWSGREADRATAVCDFCDTDFVGVDGDGGGRFADADGLADHVAARWIGGATDRLVVCTGGEPLLQLDAALIDALHARGFAIAVETNGTLAAPDGIDWICVSPKAQVPVVQKVGQELKLVFPQPGVDPAACLGQLAAHLVMEGLHLGLGIVAPADAGLVGGDQNQPSGPVDPGDRRPGPLDPDQLCRVIGITIVLIEDAIAVEDHGKGTGHGAGCSGRGGARPPEPDRNRAAISAIDRQSGFAGSRWCRNRRWRPAG
jgi:7-carboxy-7-deazaguanine synthase (Cx14CxxC type)